MPKKAGGAPAPPDPQATAAAQGAANKEAAIAQQELNMVNQRTPFGSLIYNPIGVGMGGTPRYEANIQLSPAQQQQLNLYNQIGTGQLGNVAERLSSPIPEANEATRDRTRDALLSRLEPQFARDREALETRLANQGIGLGSEAYRQGVDEFSRARNDARFGAELRAGDEMARDFQLQAASRTQPLNELAAILSGQQVQMPQFTSTPGAGVSPADYLGAQSLASQMAANNYNQRLGRQNAAMGGLFGLGSALGSAALISDRRLKTDIRKVGKTKSGLPVYTYRYVSGGPVRMGVMADEAEEKFPASVHEVNGFKAVDYAEIR